LVAIDTPFLAVNPGTGVKRLPENAVREAVDERPRLHLVVRFRFGGGILTPRRRSSGSRASWTATGGGFDHLPVEVKTS
jgi:hypothetical protein